MNFYKHHLFICGNIRDDNKTCCSNFNSQKMYRYAKDKCRNLGILGAGKIAISQSRCLGRCEHGPVAVIYPDNVWYQLVDETDIDDIINNHLLNNKVVIRLQIK